MRKLEMVNGRVSSAESDEDDVFPWCESCECFAVPDEDGECGCCSGDVTYRRVSK